MMSFLRFCFSGLCLFLFFPILSYSGGKGTVKTGAIDSTQLRSLKYRCIGPFRGGRSAAVTGVNGNDRLYYMGGAGGGVWKSTNAGNSWKNISDGFFGGSIGAVAIANSDPNVIYVGGGEVTVRGNVSHGEGVWRSTDAGKSWSNIGLRDSRHIPRIRIHPNDPDRVYVAALGHLFGPNRQRGIYRSTNGGDVWEQVLFVNENAGAVDLVLDPNNPRIMYASFWRIRRTPYSLESGGKGSGIWRSTDGGDSWEDISKAKGFPKGVWGISGIAISPKNSERIWAIIENRKGGVFRSDDGGKSWISINSERKLRQRAWYYTRIYADAKNEDLVYVLNVGFHRSKDGGKTFERVSTPHGDHHDLWINPDDPLNMIVGDDGGAQISVDGGDSWTTYGNQPTAQFYRVITDDHFPYRIYAAQQDNSSVRILHRSDSWRGITERDWEPTAGGESGHIAIDPSDEDVVYGGSYDGYLSRLNHRTREFQNITVWPNNPMGWGAKGLKYRFQWNFPLFFSSHEPHDLYAAGNVLFKSTNRGQSWSVISPDLTRNDTTKMESSGGPITKDNTSVEYYGTIFAACEAVADPNVLWTGSDDGLIHVSRDKGKSWKNVTPPSSLMPNWIMINSVEPHPTEPGGLYVAATRYKSDDFKPYLYRTTDYGASWKRINAGIPNDDFTRVIRAHPERKGLLFAGTEKGVYVSFNDGLNWNSFQQNLPQVPITDMRIKNGDLVVATQGRSLWVMDDLSPLFEAKLGQLSKSNRLYTPRDTYIMGGGAGGKGSGKNPPSGVMIRFELARKVDSARRVEIKILDSLGELIKHFSTLFSKKQLKESQSFGKLEDLKEGMNQFVWNERYPNAEGFEKLIMWAGGLAGPQAPPGEYRVRLLVDTDSFEAGFKLLADPRNSATAEDHWRRFQAALEVSKLLTKTNSSIKEIRKVKGQVNDWKAKLDTAEHQEIIEYAMKLVKDMEEIEKALYQTQNRSNQDPLNFPIRLNDKLAGVGGTINYSDGAPTIQALAVKAELTSAINIELDSWEKIRNERVPKFNEMIQGAKIEAIKMK
jgi:photosystem II stability/assembly factor-like uncharacterized protein